MAEEKADQEPTLVERWLEDQQQWQKTAMAYLDSMVKNDEFLVHLGNAMRGSLLAGKPYPTGATAQASAPEPSDERLEAILFALHRMEGQLEDLRMSLDELRAARASAPEASPEAQRQATGPKKRKPKTSETRVPHASGDAD